MASDMKVEFSAVIRQIKGMDAGYIEFPFDVQEIFSVKGQVKVNAVFDNSVVYRGSLSKMGFSCHVLGITRETRKKLDKTFGDVIAVRIEQDFLVREVTLPEDVSMVFEENPGARENYDSLSFSNKKEYVHWVESAKKEETRKKRT